MTVFALLGATALWLLYAWLASAIVAFARDVGAIVVSEGIESESELSCLMELAVGCGQGFYLARPGLGKVEPTVTNTLIAYAAKGGAVANDGDGSHSPFTTALLKSLTVPGPDVRLAFGRVRDDVLRSTNQMQEPYVYGSLGGGTGAVAPLEASSSSSGSFGLPASGSCQAMKRLRRREASWISSSNSWS